MPATQDNRSTAITTILGKDTLLLHSFEYKETLNAPFEIWARVFSADHALALDTLVGTPASIRINTSEGAKKRHLHGLIEGVTQKGREPAYAVYELKIVPWLAFLDKTSDCRIFQNKTVPDIISEVFGKAGFTDFELKLTDTYPKREYCVQYRETSANFVTRLMEAEGIGCHFKHEESKHTLVLTDAVASHEPFPGYEKVPFREAGKAADFIECIQSWDYVETARTGKYAQTDYNFKTPKAGMLATEPQPKSHGLADFERFDYPGLHDDLDAGERLAKVRLQALQADYKITRAFSGSCRGLVIGRLFTLEDHPRDDQNIEHLVTGIEIFAEEGSFASSGNSGSGATFACKITTLPSTTPYRPALDEKKLPTVAGPQTAIVTGPKGEEIHTDEHGRVTVQFHWDRYGKNDQDSSCWIRVSQAWAGKGWGAMHIPRIGQEVIVEHLEGNPDRPIITGRVYNADAKPPFPLPAQKTQSGIKSNSTIGGLGYNEIRFEDKKDDEMIFIHGQKDMELIVEQDIRETNHGDREVRVEGRPHKDAGADKEGGKLITFVSHDTDTHIGGSHHEQIDKDAHRLVKGSVLEKVEKKQSLQVEESIELNTAELVVETSKIVSAKTGEVFLEGAKFVHVKGNKIAVEASSAISLRVGGSFVVIDSGGVQIDGALIKIKSGGASFGASAAKSAAAYEVIGPACAATVLAGKLLANEETAATGKLSAPATPPAPPVPPPPPEEPPAAAEPPPAPEKEKKCSIKSLKVKCKHGRESQGGKLQVVADKKELREKITITAPPSWAGVPAKVELVHAWDGTDKVTPIIELQDEQSGGRKQIALTWGKSPGEDKWESPHPLDIPSAKKTDGEWLVNTTPDSYYLYARGCDEATRCVVIESFPADQYSGKLSLDIFKKWTDIINKNIKTFLTTASNALPGGIKVEIALPAGSAELAWGWKEEEKTWQACYEITANVGLDPIFKLTAGVYVSGTQLLGCAFGIPPTITKFLGEHVVDLRLGIDIGLVLKATGGIKGRFYHPSGEKITGEVKGGAEGSVRVYLSARAGSDYIISVDASANVETKIKGDLTSTLERSGLYFQPAVKWDGLYGYVKIKYTAFKISTKESSSERWQFFGATTIYDGGRTKLLPRN